MNALFRHRSIDEIIQDNPPLSDAQYAAFKGKLPDAPITTAEEFHYDFSKGFHNSVFNKAAQRVFVISLQEAFLGGGYAAYGLPEGLNTEEALCQAFKGRIKSMKQDIKIQKSENPLGEAAVHRRKRRVSSRQNTVRFRALMVDISILNATNSLTRTASPPLRRFLGSSTTSICIRSSNPYT